MAAEVGLSHRVKFRSTEFRLSPLFEGVERLPIANMYATLEGAGCETNLLLTERRSHLDYFQNRLSQWQ